MLRALDLGVFRVAEEILRKMPVPVQVGSLGKVRPATLNSVKRKVSFDPDATERQWLSAERHIKGRSLVAFRSFYPLLEDGDPAGLLWFVHEPISV